MDYFNYVLTTFSIPIILEYMLLLKSEYLLKSEACCLGAFLPK